MLKSNHRQRKNFSQDRHAKIENESAYIGDINKLDVPIKKTDKIRTFKYL